MEVNSAESYYQYRAESDSKIKSMSEEISRLNNQIVESKLQREIDREVSDPDVSNLIFTLIKGSATESGFNVGNAIDKIRSNEALRSFFSGANNTPATPQQRVYKQGWGD